MNNQLVPGSLGAIAKRNGQSLAESFLSVDEIILVDTSQSMAATDSTGGRSRYDVACQELRRLQAELPGKLAIFSFSNRCVLCPSGVPKFIGMGTNLLGAINYILGADGTVGITIISDGYPDPGQDHQIISLASQMTSRINTIFAGPVEDEAGRKFMAQLAQSARGKTHLSARAEDLSSGVKFLLSGGKK